MVEVMIKNEGVVRETDRKAYGTIVEGKAYPDK